MILLVASLMNLAPQEITPQWEKELLGVQYACPTVAQAVEEMTQGICGDLFKGLPLENVTTGEYVSYWGNGQVKVRLPYKNGKPHGHLHGWYEDGKDAFKGYFQNGIKQGIHMSFYLEPNNHRILRYNNIGNLHGEQIARSSRDEFLGLDYKNGVVDGEFEHRKGKDKVAVQYKQNKLQKNNQEKKGRRVIARSEDDVYWSEIISACAKMCKKEFNGRLCGDGATAPWDIERIALTFEMSRKVTLQEARNLATTLKRNVSDIVNAHEKIRPYLREYPFSPQRTDIDIEFTKTGGEVDRVSHCSWYDEIRYWKGENCICAETYEEAVRALR